MVGLLSRNRRSQLAVRVSAVSTFKISELYHPPSRQLSPARGCPAPVSEIIHYQTWELRPNDLLDYHGGFPSEVSVLHLSSPEGTQSLPVRFRESLCIDRRVSMLPIFVPTTTSSPTTEAVTKTLVYVSGKFRTEMDRLDVCVSSARFSE